MAGQAWQVRHGRSRFTTADRDSVRRASVQTDSAPSDGLRDSAGSQRLGLKILMVIVQLFKFVLDAYQWLDCFQ